MWTLAPKPPKLTLLDSSMGNINQLEKSIFDALVNRRSPLRRVHQAHILRGSESDRGLLTRQYPPFTVVDPALPNVVSGYLKELVEILAEEVGVSLVYDTNNTVGDFGVQRPDGSFTGLVGRLVSKVSSLRAGNGDLPVTELGVSENVYYTPLLMSKPYKRKQYTPNVPQRPQLNYVALAMLTNYVAPALR